MDTLKKLEHEISKLSRNELNNFRRWFHKFDAKQWDEQFESDASNAKLDKLAREALTDYRKGACKAL